MNGSGLKEKEEGKEGEVGRWSALTWFSDLQGPRALSAANHILCKALVHARVSHS